MDQLPIRIQGTSDVDLLALVLFCQVLAVDVVGLTAISILQHVLVAGLNDCAREVLSVRRL